MWPLIITLSAKELKQRYHQTYLRFVWIIINPVLVTFVFSVVFSKIARLPSEGVPYPIFSLTTLIPWALFSASLQRTCYSLIANRNLITRLSFPRITIPLGTLLASLFEFSISLIVLGIAFFLYHIPARISMFYFLPVLIVQILLTVGVGLMVAVLNVYLRDTANAMPVILQAWMLVSPVAYSLGLVNEKFKNFYLLNPMAGTLDGYRKALLHGQAPDWNALGTSFVISLALFFLGIFWFKKSEAMLSDAV